jgi:dyslexia susceptibility 1 candidate gene 1 protein
VSEEDPVWLKAKGDDFLRSGDLRSALNAYTAALEADPRMLPCLANRSVCHLRLSQAAECRADCTAALQLIAVAAGESGSPDASNGNGAMAVKLLMRRGTAACQLGLFTEALTDYHQARVKYEQLPGSQLSSLAGVSVQTLAADIVRLKLLSDAEVLKKEGDALMAERAPAAALVKYSAALDLVPVHVSCLSNRSACRLALQDVSGCVTDCSTAIALLTFDSGDASSTSLTLSSGLPGGVLPPDQARTMLANILPAAGSAKRTSWLVKTLVRRGVAHSQLGALDLAVEDYTRASALEPHNDALKADLKQLVEARDRSNSEGTAASDVIQ